MKLNFYLGVWLNLVCQNLFIAGTVFGATSLPDLLQKLNLSESDAKSDLQDATEWNSLVKQVTDLAHQTSSDLKLAASKTEVSLAQKDVARGGYFPSIRVGANIEQSQTNDSNAQSEINSLQRQINLVLRQNIFNGGNDTRQVQSADRNIATAKAQQSLTEANLDYQVAATLLNFHDAILRKEIAEIILTETSQLESVIDKKQAAGRAGRIDVEQTKMQQIETQTQVLEIDTEIAEKNTRCFAEGI